MKLIIIHKNKNSRNDKGNLIRFALSGEPIASLILGGLCKEFPQGTGSSSHWDRNSKVVCAIPKEWEIEHIETTSQIITYIKNVPFYLDVSRKIKRNSWSVFANGRFAAQINMALLNKILVDTKIDLLAVNAEPELLAYREKVRLTGSNKVAGLRRYYSDSIEPAPLPVDWPHYIFIKTDVLEQILVEDAALPGSFSAFLERCRSASLTLHAISIAGMSFDLETEDGLLDLCRARLSRIRPSLMSDNRNPDMISPNSRLVGKVLLGKNVHISPDAIIVGPTVIGNNVKIKKGAVINSSIIGPDVCVPQNQVVQDRVVKGPRCNWEHLNRSVSNFSKQIIPKLALNHHQHANDNFRSWPRLSYAGIIKRAVDCLAAIIVLILFAPIIPFITLAIKLNSPGPVFFKDKRQGLHGKEFRCLKFRSMDVGSDKIQDRLRVVSQVDGPQFKITDDPRINAIGKFLRDTYIDEIPQFFNVLLGQMSVVGPRPSPESENTLCPYWRDARLSVRPGITGLWQICRTRRPMKDFQEWIHWDSEYIRNLSLRMDLWISWQTTKKLFDNFIRQF